MAGYGSDFSDEDLANVITFIRSEFGGFKELTTAAQVAEWRKKYVDVPGLTVIDKNGEDVLVGGLAREEIEQVNNPVKRTPAGQRKLIQIGGEEVAFRWCPPTGKNGFDMGSPAEEELRDRDETQHRVVLTHGFWMMETEVTERLWKAVTGNAVDYRDSKKPPRTDFAVEQRTWDDCQKFISMVNASGALPEGLKAALPTEAQWEYACRAGTRTVFHFGDSLGRDQASIDGRSPYGGAKKRPFKPNPQPVRSYAANAWGLYDMHGGLWEWCADWYGPYISGLQTDPVGAETGPYRVLRGGSRESDARYCRSAFRGKLRPNDDSRAGFRLSLQLETP